MVPFNVDSGTRTISLFWKAWWKYLCGFGPENLVTARRIKGNNIETTTECVVWNEGCQGTGNCKRSTTIS